MAALSSICHGRFLSRHGCHGILGCLLPHSELLIDVPRSAAVPFLLVWVSYFCPPPRLLVSSVLAQYDTALFLIFRGAGVRCESRSPFPPAPPLFLGCLLCSSRFLCRFESRLFCDYPANPFPCSFFRHLPRQVSLNFPALDLEAVPPPVFFGSGSIWRSLLPPLLLSSSEVGGFFAAGGRDVHLFL